MNTYNGTEEYPALSLVAPVLSRTRACCPPNPSSPHPHRSGNSSLPVPPSPSHPRLLVAWASQAPRSLVAALAALAITTLPPRRALRPPYMSSERGGHQTTADSSIPPLSGHPPPPTTNPPLRSPRRCCCRCPSRPRRGARTPPPPPPSHDIPAGQAPQEECAPVPVDAPEPPQLVRLPGAVEAFQPGVPPLLPRPPREV